MANSSPRLLARGGKGEPPLASRVVLAPRAPPNDASRGDNGTRLPPGAVVGFPPDPPFDACIQYSMATALFATTQPAMLQIAYKLAGYSACQQDQQQAHRSRDDLHEQDAAGDRHGPINS